MYFSGPDENDLDEQLKKSDPFIDDFVPTEYTDYLAMKPKELLARQVYIEVFDNLHKWMAWLPGWGSLTKDWKKQYSETGLHTWTTWFKMTG